MAANVFTVPVGTPFLTALARAILHGDLPVEGGKKPDPLMLPKISLLLPTRRAARAARDAFLAVAGTRAVIMPRILQISEGEADASLIAELGEGSGDGAAALALPPAIGALDRTLALMQLVARWRAAMESSGRADDAVSGATPAQAAHLANELAKLMDDIEREHVSLGDIGKLVPDTYAEHWRKTVEFVKIVTDFWPAYLAEQGLSSPEARRNALITAEAQRIAKLKPDDIVIVAGVTGSIPATVALMKAVIARPSGAIVLPGLDQDLDEEGWAAISTHPEHPQSGLKKLIGALGVDRRDVRPLNGGGIDPVRQARAAFFSEAMRPSSTTSEWHRYATTADRTKLAGALAGISLIEAPSAQDEAEVVALILREAIETPGRTAALVSPDRILARRVAIRLETWGIRVDDSAGRPFVKTVPGVFLALVIGAVVSGFAPAETMALLRHPLCRASLKPFDIRRFARALEIIAFRTTYLGRGLEGIAGALDAAERDVGKKRQHRAAQRLFDEDRQGARDLVQRLIDAFQPLTILYATKASKPLADFARAHAAVAEALATLPADEISEAGAPTPLWQGEAGETASRFFTGLLNSNTVHPDIGADDYADLYATLLARENVRERKAVHPRVAIWGPFEARLQQPDMLILGSLNEGTWPEAAEPSAWLNRPMRHELGLPSPEEETGRAAHDFVSLLGADTVYLTRASKSGGVPTVPSRWLMRVSALLGGVNLKDALTPDREWLGWARARDKIGKAGERLKAPAPRPDMALRPRKLSVTEIERWMANPYAIFARHVLKLEPLPLLGASPDASLRGALVHEVMSRFANAYPSALPDDALAELEGIADAVLQSYTGHARIAAFWLPRLKRFLTWFADGERERRAQVATVFAETPGSIVLPGGQRPFTLTARADRIDDTVRSLVITDYKTGRPPSAKNVTQGRAPQLPLEAAIALGEIGFPHLAGRPVEALRYIRASGGEPPGDVVTIDKDVAGLAGAALAGLERLVTSYDDPATPYRAIRRPNYAYDYDDYAHLARVAEWSAHVEDELP